MISRLLYALIFTLTCSCLSAQHTLIIKADPEMKDAYVNSITSTTNYKDYPNYFALAVEYQFTQVLVTRSLFQFDLSSIPVTAVILDAKLDLYFAINPSNPSLEQMGENSSYIRRITEDWQEEIVTWVNQPQWTDENQVIIPMSNYPDQDYEGIDVTQLVQDMVTQPGSSFGFMMMQQTEEPQRAMCFASGDYYDEALRPVLSITYYNCPPPSVSFSYSRTGHNVEFSGISGDGNNWSWDFGDGFGSNLQNPSHYYTSLGKYQVCLTVDNTCEYYTYCDSVFVCDPVMADYSYVADELTVNFSNNSINATSYQWDFGDGFYSEAQNPAHAFSSSGKYQVCLTVDDTCDSDIYCDSVFVCAHVISDFGYAVNGLTVNFSDSSQNASTYRWEFGDGSFSEIQNPVYYYSQAGHYEVCLTSSNSCSDDILCKTISVEASGVQEIDADLFIKIDPNPASAFVNLIAEKPIEGTLKLVSQSGALLFKTAMNLSKDSPYRIDLESYQAGIYFIILDSPGFTCTKKLVLLPMH